MWEAALPASSPFRTVDRLDASFHIHPNQFLIKEADLRWGGLRIHVSGELNLPNQPAKRSLPEFKTQASQLFQTLETLRFDREPEIDIRFLIDPVAPENNTIEAACLIQSDRGQLTATGSANLGTQIAQLSITNSLRADELLTLLPPRLQRDLALAELHPLGAVDFTVALGPAPIEQLFEQFRADIHNLPVRRKDLTLDPLAFEFVRDGDRLDVNKIQAGANDGTLTGTFTLDLSSGAWDSSLHAIALPGPVGTLVGPGLQHWIDRATFTNQPPDIHVNLSGGGAQGSIKMDGTFSTENLTCTGGPLDTLQIGMAYSNRLLTLAPLHAVHENKKFDGTVHVDFTEKLAKFDIATNQFPLVTLARVLAPNRPSPLEHFTFNGPITSDARGQIDYRTWTNHIVHGTLRAEQVSAGEIQADLFRSQIDCLGTQLNFTNTFIQLYNGTLDGSAQFDLILRDGTAPYHINLNATQLALKQMLQGKTPGDSEPAEGLLSGNLDLAADAKAGFWNSVKGQGQVHVEKGQLARIPLIGGFSRLIPGIKLFSITTLFADFELRDKKLQSENIQLGGTLLSAHAQGRYSPSAGLDFRLRAVPLRNTRENKKWYQLHLWSAEALKKTTAPLFDLLEFNLKGTLENPQWRMKALPKEIYEIIQRKKAAPAPQP